MKTKILIVLAAFVLSSCAGMTYVSAPKTTASFIDKDIETVRKVSYTLPKTYVFGIGGMSKKARNTNIADELMKRAQLQPNEALSYITYSRNTNCYAGIVTRINLTATGYVIKATSKTDVDIPHNVSTPQATLHTSTPVQPQVQKEDYIVMESELIKERKPFNKPKGYFGRIEAGYGYMISDDRNVISANLINGFRVSPQFGLGIGTGVNYFFDHRTDLTIPVFLHLRSDFLNQSTTPFASINLGYNFSSKKRHDWTYEGLFAEPSVGIGTQIGNRARFNASLGVYIGRTLERSVEGSLVQMNSYWTENREIKEYSDYGITPNIKLGIEF